MTETAPSNAIQAQLKAVQLAREELFQLDLSTVCSRTGLKNDASGRVRLPFIGRTAVVDFSNNCAVAYSDATPLSPLDEALVLRYCAAKTAIVLKQQLITFRDMPGGNFYVQPILNRTVQLIVSRFQNDVTAFAKAIAAFPHKTIDGGDFSARVNAIGLLDFSFVYHLGDDEFPPSVDVTFDKAVASIYTLDEAAALVHRLCLAIVRN